eukprot:6178750-Pleurochrysis_carterae.AAC.1
MLVNTCGCICMRAVHDRTCMRACGRASAEADNRPIGIKVRLLRKCSSWSPFISSTPPDGNKTDV